jgi:hypothetical protein
MKKEEYKENEGCRLEDRTKINKMKRKNLC